MNLKQHAFITEYLRFGDPLVAYHNAYQCYEASARTKESAANRLMRNPEIEQAIKDAQERIRYEVEQELKDQLRVQLLTIQRKREILARIAEGDVYIEQNYKGKDCRTCTQMVKPTINQMLKAIDLDSKLAGDYKSHKPNTNVLASPIPKEEKSINDEKRNKTQQIIPVSVERITIQPNISEESKTPVRQEGRRTLDEGEGLHITHAGLRKLLSTPLKKQQDVLLE